MFQILLGMHHQVNMAIHVANSRHLELRVRSEGTALEPYIEMLHHNRIAAQVSQIPELFVKQWHGLQFHESD